ncbi:hypothetical protein [uncultured Polaribacter sp.]|uniref:hypothetical protein n=1 Tax=uncultured Polaribacter sp. TaxID=174711 RepID=UPI00261432BC|nr:hypothetical protein [uncultured Polaribacter sp.]
MELTKEQIQYIDKRLQTEGVKFWDIRIEMLDHVVSDVEIKLEKEEEFKKLVQKSFVSLGWKDSFKDLTKRRLLGINKIVRKQYFNKVKELITNLDSIFIILLFGILYYSTIFVSTINLFKTTTIILLLGPVIYGVFLNFKEVLSQKKSGYLTYSSFYVFFSFLLLNGVIQFVKPEGIISVSKETQLLVWYIVTVLNSIFTYAGVLVHLKTLKKIKIIELNLFS